MKPDRGNAVTSTTGKMGVPSSRARHVFATTLVLWVLAVGVAWLDYHLVVNAIDIFAESSTEYLWPKFESGLVLGVAMLLLVQTPKLAIDIAIRGWKATFEDLQGERKDD